MRTGMSAASLMAILLGFTVPGAPVFGQDDTPDTSKPLYYQLTDVSSYREPNKEGTDYDEEVRTLVATVELRLVEEKDDRFHFVARYEKYELTVTKNGEEASKSTDIPGEIELWMEENGEVSSSADLPAGTDLAILLPYSSPPALEDGDSWTFDRKVKLDENSTLPVRFTVTREGTEGEDVRLKIEGQGTATVRLGDIDGTIAGHTIGSSLLRGEELEWIEVETTTALGSEGVLVLHRDSKARWERMR